MPVHTTAPVRPAAGDRRRRARRIPHRVLLAPLSGAALSLLLVGCGAATPADPRAGQASAAATASAAASTSQVSTANCDRTVTLPRPARRIVSIYPTTTEMLLQLGAADQLAGQAYTDQSPPLPWYADAYAKVTTLSSGELSRETLLEARPDLVVADGEYHFDGTALPTLKEMTDLGIPVYVISSFCHLQVTIGRIGDVTTDLNALGTLTGHTAEARAAIADVNARLADVDASVAGKPRQDLVLAQLSEGSFYALSGGLYSDVVNRAGGRNMFDGELPDKQYYAQVSTETVTKKNPPVIVYAYNDDADRKRSEDYLRQTFPTVEAVRNNRLIAIPSVSFISLRAVDGAETLAQNLHRR